MSQKLTNEIFIEKANEIHNNKYDYSLVKYSGSKATISIICPIHGEFEQTPNNHLNGKGCHQCGKISRVSKQRMTNTIFIEKANEIHNSKYDYSLVDYVTNKTKIKVICLEHGIFNIKPNCHLTGGGCPKCVGRGKTTEEYIYQCNNVHRGKYDYTKTIYLGVFNKTKIICPIHGEFEQTPNNHLSGAGCPICKESKGELEIRNFLTKNKIKFINQYRFTDCRDKKPLPFDFYLPDYNLCIEFQGEQHYRPINYFGGLNKFNIQVKRDKIKYEYCQNKQINLIVIKYDDNVIDKLNEVNYVC